MICLYLYFKSNKYLFFMYHLKKYCNSEFIGKYITNF